MATAAKVIKAALQKILVQASEAPLEASEYQDAIQTLNDMMLGLDADGITLGYTEISNLADEITVPPGALRGVIDNLALELSPEYDGVVTQSLMMIADQGLKTMRRLSRSVLKTPYPSTLPTGSGNNGSSVWNDTFYQSQEDAVLAETTGSIALESGTNEAANG